MNKWTTVESIQNEFRSCFPALKLEFFVCKQSLESAYTDSNKLQPEYVFAFENDDFLDDGIEINSSDKVIEVEERFYEKYGLCAQIFFKSNNKWIQSVKSDHYSLLRLERELGFLEYPLLL